MHQEVVERLRDMIVEGKLVGGTRINERVICEQLGISRTPLREALLVLATEGLVEIVPRRGARVAALAPERIRDLLELLGGIEALAGELACERASDEEIAAIRGHHEAMLKRYRAGDRLAYFKLNENAIHDAIVAAAHNLELATQHRMLRARVLRALYAPNASPERWHAAVAEHEAFIVALMARDGPRLGQLLRRHKQQTWLALRDSLEPSRA